MTSLVAYYSNTGNTKLVANTFRQSLDADIIEIKDLKDKSTKDPLKYFSQIINAVAKINTETDPESLKVDKYDLICIGTPVWASSTTPAVYNVLSNTDFKNKRVILFNTMDSNGGYKSVKEMKEIVQKNHGKVVATFSIVSSGGHTNIIIRAKQALKDLNLI